MAGAGDDEGVQGEQEDAEDEAADGLALTVPVRPASGPPRRRPHLDPLAAADPRSLGRRALVRPGSESAPPQRFARALAAQRRRLAGVAADAPEPALAGAPIVATGRVPYASNAVFVLELDAPAPDGLGRLRAVYKPARGERPLWDFTRGSLHLREVATRLVDAALGFDLVPPTVLRDGPVGPGSVQLLVEVAQRPPRDVDRAALGPRICAMAALDVLVNNADRKTAHLLVDSAGRLRGIDHGLSFLPYPRQRTVLLELGGSRLPDDTAAAVRGLEEDATRREALVDELHALLSPSEVAAFRARLRELAADPVYPELDPWDGRPFEWW